MSTPTFFAIQYSLDAIGLWPELLKASLSRLQMNKMKMRALVLISVVLSPKDERISTDICATIT
jgi:hypothetical protein